MEGEFREGFLAVTMMELPIADVDFGGSHPRIAAVTRGGGGCSGLPQSLKTPTPFRLRKLQMKWVETSKMKAGKWTSQ